MCGGKIFLSMQFETHAHFIGFDRVSDTNSLFICKAMTFDDANSTKFGNLQSDRRNENGTKKL